jgi:predicted transcriptional regulator
MPHPRANDRNLTRAELDRIRRFQALYNRISDRLREMYPQGERRPGFPRLVNLYFRGRTEDAEPRFLRKLGDLRNSLVHGETRDYEYVAVPTRETLRQLLGTYRELMGHDLAINQFPKEVDTVTSDETLSNVLGRMRDKDFSQFPVYDGRDFKGLLTENGVVQWLAESIFGGKSVVESYDITSRKILLQSTSVKEVLKKDENRVNVIFVENILTVREVRQHFSENNVLEAILITENGRSDEELLAIATRWDMAGK